MKQIKALIPRIVKRKLNTIASYPNELMFWLGAESIYKSDNFKKLETLRDCNKNKRCFIIGSGPSINKMDLSVLKNEITFGHNAFYLIADKVGFLPTYYVVEDPLPAEDNANEINALSGTQKIVAHYLKYCLDDSENTIYPFFDIHYGDSNTINFPQFSFGCDRKVYWGGTVVYFSIQLAAFMGCNKIYLLGVDLNYKIPVYADGEVITSRENDLNHFHPDYFGKGKRYHDPHVDRMQKSIEYSYQVLKKNGCSLYNATCGGNLINVPRVSFIKLF